MNKLIDEKDEHLYSINFMLTTPVRIAKSNKGNVSTGLKDIKKINSPYHQNRNRKLLGGFYKSITRIAK